MMMWRIMPSDRDMSLWRGGTLVIIACELMAGESGNEGRRNALANHITRIFQSRELDFIAVCI